MLMLHKAISEEHCQMKPGLKFFSSLVSSRKDGQLINQRLYKRCVNVFDSVCYLDDGLAIRLVSFPPFHPLHAGEGSSLLLLTLNREMWV